MIRTGYPEEDPMKGKIYRETPQSKAANILDRWEDHYCRWSDDKKYRDGTTKAEKKALLKALPDPATPEDIAAVFGNTTWTDCRCSICNNENVAAVTVFESYCGEDTLTVCDECMAGFRRHTSELETHRRFMAEWDALPETIWYRYRGGSMGSHPPLRAWRVGPVTYVGYNGIVESSGRTLPEAVHVLTLWLRNNKDKLWRW